jgi:hypothetical protein
MYRFLFLLALSLVLIAPAAGQAPADWQQQVQYEMDITLKADRHRMFGTQRITYTNNSPDTLRTVYYHLYFNAFNPNSMMAERNRHLPDPDGRIVPRIFNLGPDEVGFHRVESLTQDGSDVSFTITDTVLRVDLAAPIPPGGSTTFAMTFNSQVPLQTRRSGRDNREGIDYSMSQWYPKLAEYDERGWHADPYVGREFYAPYGTFDVEITLPAHYTVGATGMLQNPDDVGHGYDLEGTGTYRPGDGNNAPSDSLTWHFRAENVHDFAWAADPDYIHERVDVGDGTVYHLLYEPDVEDRWQPMDQWVPQLIQFFSDEYGPYPYPQFTVAQAGDGGMEYPMINFLTGERSPGSLLGVTAHEAAHEWFYAALGTNEADYAWMDEGFTSYATTESVAHVRGIDNPSHRRSALSVINAQHAGIFERFSTPSDWFTTNTAYGVAAYPGGAMLVDMLGYVISDPMRDQWLKEYVRRRTFQHPDPYDLEAFAEDVSGLHLDWYFEQVTNMTRTLDYAVTDLTQQRSGDTWTATVQLERKDEAVMPVDVRLTLADGSTQWVNVPLGIMQGHKPVPASWIVADPWLWTFPTYTLTVDLPAQVTAVEIDPMGRTPDVNRLNNTDRLPRRTAFLRPAQPTWFDYGIGYRPLVQYADDFGFGAGLQVRGRYIFGQHQLQGTVKLWPQVLFSGGDEPTVAPKFDFTQPGSGGSDRLVPADVSGFDGIDYALTYTHDLRTLGPRATFSLSAKKHLGLLENTAAVQKPLGPPITAFTGGTQQTVSVQLMHQYNSTDRVFGATDTETPFRAGPASPIEEVTTRINPFRQTHLMSAKAEYRVESGMDWLALGLELGGSIRNTGFPFRLSERLVQSANRFSLSAGKSVALGAFHGQATFQLGLGPDNLAGHKLFRLGSPSLESLWRNAAFRNISAAFADPAGDAHLVGISPSGPVAYLRAFPFSTAAGPAGSRIIAGRLSLHTPPFTGSSLVRPLRFGLFSGIGNAWSSGAFLAGFDADNLLADAGVSVDYDVSELNALDRWTAQSDVLSNLQITARFPVWASDPGLTQADDEEFAFRWLLGIKMGL